MKNTENTENLYLSSIKQFCIFRIFCGEYFLIQKCHADPSQHLLYP